MLAIRLYITIIIVAIITILTWQLLQAADSGAFDYTQLPHRLDANYLKFDSDAVQLASTRLGVPVFR